MNIVQSLVFSSVLWKLALTGTKILNKTSKMKSAWYLSGNKGTSYRNFILLINKINLIIDDDFKNIL